ncbi:cell division control protein 11 [Trichomonascus vanleenenianus]|uniref:septin family protein n=1 Tax=Trichomonascus vanleenenianus TaxID=2268995 RepID=UPI003ECAE0A0
MNITHTSPEQMRRRRIIKKGFQLCIMVCGHSGTGKSTFINTLCDGEVYPPNEPIRSTTEMTVGTHHINIDEEDGTVISLTVVDTPGFGDAIDNNDCRGKILKYIEEQYDDILAEENRVKRKPKFKDNRVHVLLYFIAPTGHGLKELDIDLMLSLSTRVNVIPVLAKADTLTAEEISLNKYAIMESISHFKIPIYYFPCDEDEDEDILRECTNLRKYVPFAIVGSNDFHRDETGNPVRARQYPWGLVKVNDPAHSDFSLLRSVLFGSHLEELRDLTQDIMYENYRTEKLSEERDEEFTEEEFEEPEFKSSGNNTNCNTNEESLHHSMPGVSQPKPLESKRLQDIEQSIQIEIEKKRKELLRQEAELKELTEKLAISKYDKRYNLEYEPIATE